MLIGYQRVSKADGSQTTALQRDALLTAGVDMAHLYEDHASGRLDGRPGMGAALKALRAGVTLWCGSWTGLGATCATSSTRCMI
jgi:DNA invertase Pin-like site-specific DNA recombinase